MTQWENLPQPVPQRPVAPVAAAWSGFSADPRQPANTDLRASDADRGFAARIVDEALAEGRLDPAEHAERLLQAGGARTLGELVPLVSDLMVASAARGVGARARGRLARAGVMGWIGLAILFNTIWLMTSLTVGTLLYYWPMWPMLGTGIPVLVALTAGGSAGQARDDDRSRPAARRDARYQRHGRGAVRPGGAVGLPPGSTPPNPPGPPEQDLR